MTAEYPTGRGELGYRDYPTEPEVLAERRFLRNYSFCLLGSADAAEEVVRETYTRWYLLSETQRAAEAPDAWLLLVASRLCIGRDG
jgi:RNA polymerase sigma-70 factor (ECF subfamily)